MSETVRVEKIDEVFMRVHCDDGLARDLYDFFSFTVPGAKFMPSYKNRYWDGKVRLFSIKTNKIYIGLLPYVCLLYTSPSPRDLSTSRMPSSA